MFQILCILSLLGLAVNSQCISTPNAAICATSTVPSGFDCCAIVENLCSPANGADCPTVDPTQSPVTPAPTTPAPTTPAPTTPAPTTPAPTTPAPTTPAPTTPAPTTTTTPAPTTTTTTTTTCWCPTPAPIIPTPAPTASKKTKGGSGLGVGECDCEGGLLEIRYKYKGTTTGVQIQIFYDEKKTTVLCTFKNVNPNDEIVCSIEGMGYSDFQNETPFVITYPNGGTCEAQYHTSCSSDIVGLVQPECTELVVSGWRDVDTPAADCDDGLVECSCDTTTTTTPPLVDVIVGDNCYCEVDNCTPAPISLTSTKKKKKKKSKSKDKNSGLGCGDCDCDKDYGMVEMRVQYLNAPTVDIEFYDKSGDGQICQVLDVAQGEEAICNTDTNSAYEKLETNTYVKVINTQTGAECLTIIHTSCSSDIVGTYGDNSACGLLVTGWRDGNPLTNDCDDGYELCNCDGTYIYEPEDPDTNDVVSKGDVCFCSNRAETSSITSLDDLTSMTTAAPVTSKKKKKKGGDTGYGYGYCDCDGGIQVLRFVYKNTEPADSITVFLDGLDSTPLCTTNDVTFGQEIECTANSVGAEKLEKDTYVRVRRGNTVCEGSWHTSCSRDIIGWTAEGCTDVVCSGWSDNNSAGDCDDGFEPCECVDPCNEYSVGCTTYAGCAYDDTTGVCYSISAAPALMKNVYQVLALVVALLFIYN